MRNGRSTDQGVFLSFKSVVNVELTKLDVTTQSKLKSITISLEIIKR